MIDLHCHVLPGIDDGPRNVEESIALARAMVEDGITHAVTTPHIHFGRYDNTLASVTKACENFRRELSQAEIPLELGVAAEVRIADEIVILVEQQALPFIGRWQGDNLLLLELPHSHIPAGVEQLVQWLAKKGIRSMIAHPEFNKDILRDFSKIKQLVQLDCLFQITASAIVGQFGENAQNRARQMLEQDLVTIIATDAHHATRRPPLLTAAHRAATAVVGESKAGDLVRNNPGRIAASQFADQAEGELLPAN